MRTQRQPPSTAVAPQMVARLTSTVLDRLPCKSFGYLLAADDSDIASDFVLFEANVRNSPAWKPKFESYGRYFIEHDDAGFVATPEESWHVQQEVWNRRASQVGVFHSHLRHPANFSGIDYDMHIERFEDLWHMIVSVRNPRFPQARIYAVSREAVEETMHAECGADTAQRIAFPLDAAHAARAGGRATDAAVSKARECLALAADGTPGCKDNEAICACIGQLLLSGDAGAFDEFVTHGFLRGSGDRYDELVAPGMRYLHGGAFEMGADPQPRSHFCGEVPRHAVNLSAFAIAETSVTRELYQRFDRSRPSDPHDASLPATGVTWFDAAIFALWMGCRLPTEAEWEYACGAGAAGEWACEAVHHLARHAWYSENSHGDAHAVGLLQPNAFGLHDMHGNVWEWCFDAYDPQFYAAAPLHDPVCLASPFARRSCRGGSVHALAEMCRTRYRWSEPAAFEACDLGFRLASSVHTR